MEEWNEQTDDVDSGREHENETRMETFGLFSRGPAEREGDNYDRPHGVNRQYEQGYIHGVAGVLLSPKVSKTISRP